MANFTIKTIKEIYDDFMARYNTLRSQQGDNTPLLEKAVIKSVGYAIAGVAGVLWRLCVWLYKQCFPQTADLPALKLWGNLVGVDYKNGEATNVIIKLTNVTAATLASGTVYKDLTTGLIYKTMSQAAANNNEITATAVCTTSGTVGNLPVGTVLNITNPVAGIPSTATITSISLQGTENEGVEDYRKRVLYKFRNKNQSGSPLDYYNWVMEVSGIADALPYVLAEGVVTIYCVANGSGLDRTPSGSVSPNPFPNWVDGQFTDLTGSGQFLQIANAIEGSDTGVHDRRPVTASVKLEQPNYTGFKIEIGGLTSTDYNEQIKNILIGYFDERRPHLVVLGYPISGAKINSGQLNAATVEAIEGETFTSFVLKDEDDNVITEATLGIGCLAYLSELTINGTVYYTTDEET